MKKFIVLAILLSAVTAQAWTISWNPVAGVDGYTLYWKPLSATVFAVPDVGTSTTFDMEPLGLIDGTRYEFYVVAHSQGSTSAESDHIRWTKPADPVIVELPDSPQRLVIEF